jgi:hypothetical protein
MEFLILIVAGVAGFFLLYCVWKFLTTDWLGLYYEDKSSPYYHDKTGQGRGR